MVDSFDIKCKFTYLKTSVSHTYHLSKGRLVVKKRRDGYSPPRDKRVSEKSVVLGATQLRSVSDLLLTFSSGPFPILIKGFEWRGQGKPRLLSERLPSSPRNSHVEDRKNWMISEFKISSLGTGSEGSKVKEVVTDQLKQVKTLIDLLDHFVSQV